MKAPGFWTRPPGPLSTLLAPASAIWTAVGRVRQRRADPWRAPVPIVCVGNLTAGGAGKTPVALDLLDRLTARGVAAHALSRGHGGRLAGPLRVDPANHTAADVGDEPLLLAAAAPAWIARDRAAGARAAIQAGARAIVLDDGFQNPGLAKDLSLVVVDGATGFGNGRVIPAGPLREPVADGLARAQAVVVIGPDATGVAAMVGAHLPVLGARLEPDPEAAAGLSATRLLAFAGIGRPGKFFDTLRGLGADLAEAVPFPDHHLYTPAELEGLLSRATLLDARLVTTAKDAVRLPGDLRNRVAVLPVRIVWHDPAAVDALLRSVIPADGQP